MIKEKVSNKIILGAILLVVVIIGLGFLPSMNGNVQVLSSDNGEGLGNIYDALKYEKSIHILAMLLLGFGFLMVFIRKHGKSSVTATFLAVSIALPMYMLVKSYISEDFLVINIDSLILAEFAAASLLIAMGAPLGRLKMDQYIALGLLFIPAYIFNEWLILESGLFTGFVDVGGSVVIHAFGAYFGLGLVVNTLSKFKNQPEGDSHIISHQFTLIGSMVLWIFWPSFTSALVAPGEVVVTAINTIFALCGATLATYVFTRLLRGKVDIEDIANAALAGGVAIGSVCNTTTPGFAILIGLSAGIVSTVGYAVIAPKVEKIIKGTDTCGVHNLHGMPGVLGGIFGVFVSGSAGVQLGGIVVTVIVGFVLGNVTGLIIRLLGQKEKPYDDADEFEVVEALD